MCSLSCAMAGSFNPARNFTGAVISSAREVGYGMSASKFSICAFSPNSLNKPSAYSATAASAGGAGMMRHFRPCVPDKSSGGRPPASPWPSPRARVRTPNRFGESRGWAAASAASVAADANSTKIGFICFWRSWNFQDLRKVGELGRVSGEPRRRSRSHVFVGI